MFLTQSEDTLNDNDIISNTAEFGGGLQLVESAATLSGNLVSGNTAGQRGGGMYVRGSDDSSLIRNNFTNNAAEFGGGVFIAESAVSLSGSLIRGNTASQRGGGLYLRDDGDVSLVNIILAENHADSEGSGLTAVGSTPRLLHTTIARNTGGDGSGILVDKDSEGDLSIVSLVNTVIVSQTVGVRVTQGNTATLGATLWGTGAWANGSRYGGQGTVSPGTLNLEGDPVFLAPQIGDYHLRPGSAAIDVGVYSGVTTDIDGDNRPYGDAVDIGADEYVPSGRINFLPLLLKDSP